ncbi:MAG: hypothetical protein HY765_06470, partial [Rhodomicrobium sp.]|nr:hypothetical protein [Rhodomicrobium sp.]
MKKNIFAFGHWPSPVSAAAVAEGALRFGRVQACGDAVYWSESRPAEKGRTPVMRWNQEEGVSELLPAPYSARSRVHEYGGGEFLIADGRLFFVNDTDQDVYDASLIPSGGRPDIRRLTNLPGTRFADLAWDAGRNRLIAIGETRDAQHRELPQNALWEIPAGQGNADAEPAPLLTGHDFCASPRLSTEGSRLAFLAWNLPAMPWDAAQLFVADIAADGSLGAPVPIAGGSGSACFQPEWGADGALYFVWDADGLGNLFRWREGEQPGQITYLDAELSMPLWNLNAASYALLAGNRAYCNFVRNGEAGSGIVDLRSGTFQAHDNGLSNVSTVAAGGAGIALAGMRDDEPLCIALDPGPDGPGAAPAIIR